MKKSMTFQLAVFSSAIVVGLVHNYNNCSTRSDNDVFKNGALVSVCADTSFWANHKSAHEIYAERMYSLLLFSVEQSQTS